MRRIATALAAASLLVPAAGCFGVAAPGGSGAGGSAPQVPPGTAPPGTHVVVRYTVTRAGLGAGPPARRARCPALARCRRVPMPGSRGRRWELIARRTLTCRPDRGGYRDPAAACRALRDLARLEAHDHARFCMCPFELSPAPTAVGRVDRRRIRFELGGCAACGLGGHALADMRVLMPG